MSTFVTTICGAAVALAIAWAYLKIMAIRAHEHHAMRFLARAQMFLEDETVPKRIGENLLLMAPLVESTSMLGIFDEPVPDSHSHSGRKWEDVENISDEKRQAFVQAIVSYLLAISHLSLLRGPKFRTGMLDHLLDRKTAIREAERAYEMIPCDALLTAA